MVSTELRTTHSYDSRTRLIGIASPNGVTETRAYDDDDRLTLLLHRAPGSTLGWLAPQNHAASDTMQWFGLAYDARPKVAVATTYFLDSLQHGYNGLGQLQWMYHTSLVPGVFREEDYTLDPLGNLTKTVTPQTNEVTDGVHSYDAVTGHLSTIMPPPGQTGPQAFGASYDEAGNQAFTIRARFAQAWDTLSHNPEVIAVTNNTVYAYDALGRLRFVRDRVQSHATEVMPADARNDEETRYDALGRRVWITSIHLADTTQCTSGPYCSVTRFVWDGSQLLAEFRMPMSQAEGDTTTVYSVNCHLPCPIQGPQQMDTTYSLEWGQATYVHGMGIDQPLAVYRAGLGIQLLNLGSFVMYPHVDWKGNATAISFNTGGPTLNGSAQVTPPLPNEQNADITAYRARTSGGRQIMSWQGSLLNGQLGENGLEYKRNRYYDPQSGRFTQQDPIGLAGGTNSYGFAGGDPVNSSDPFGLCPGINGTDPKTVDDCPDESKRGFWDRLWNGPRYVEHDGRRDPILELAFPSWIGGAGSEGFGSFGSFKRAMGAAGEGMQWHHIVEQAGNVERFGAEAVHNADNLIAVPTAVHERISAYYSSVQAFTNGQTVRMWLRDQSFVDQVRFGLDVLKNFGINR